MPWKRRALRRGPLKRALNIADLRALALRRVPHFAFEYVEGGAEDEATLRANRADFARWRLLPRTLIDTRTRSLAGRLLGRPLAAPLLIGRTPPCIRDLSHSLSGRRLQCRNNPSSDRGS